MVAIREARQGDIPSVLLLIHEFQDETLDSYKLFCDDDKAVKLMETVWQNALVMTENEEVIGVIAGMIGSSMVSTDPVMQELIWFVKKGHRQYGRLLLERFEQFSINRGCKHILMVHMGRENMSILERFYTRRGYELLECQYIKCLQ